MKKILIILLSFIAIYSYGQLYTNADTLILNKSLLPPAQTSKAQFGVQKMILGDIYASTPTTTYAPTFLECILKSSVGGTPLKARGSMGMLSAGEMNFSMNMDYTTAKHLPYDTSKVMSWFAFCGGTNPGFVWQYVGANQNRVTDYWDAYGQPLFQVLPYSQPGSGKAIENFSSVYAADYHFADITNTPTVTATDGTIRLNSGSLYYSSSQRHIFNGGLVADNQGSGNPIFTGNISGSQAIRVTNTGRLNIGPITANTNLLAVGDAQVYSDYNFGNAISNSSDESTAFIQTSFNNNSGIFPVYAAMRGRGTHNSPSSVQNGDQVGSFQFDVYNSGARRNAVAIKTYVDGTPGGTYAPTKIVFMTASSTSTIQERLTIKPSGNIKIAGNAIRSNDDGTNHLDIFDGEAPDGTLENGISLYSTSGELRVMDSYGNATLLSPHEEGTNNWIYYSVNTRTGKVLKIDMEKIMRALNDKFGWDFVHEYSFENK